MIATKKIEQKLMEIGGKPNLKGFSYCITAIQIYDNQKSMTKEIYPSIAKQFNTTSSRVERAIRHLISRLIDDKLKIMTNSEFIAVMKLTIGDEK